jgi:hypothetical protein
VRRELTVGAVLLGTAVLTWVTWPRPAATIEIAVGGAATVGGAALPETLVLKAKTGGAVVRVVNRDTVRHALALFAADAGATVDYTIPRPGTYGGACSAHPTGALTYLVR